MDVYRDEWNNEHQVVINHADELDRGLVEAIKAGHQALVKRDPIFRILPKLKTLAMDAMFDDGGPAPVEERAAKIVRKLEQDGRSRGATTVFSGRKAKLSHRLALRGICNMTDRKRADELFDHIAYHQE